MSQKLPVQAGLRTGLTQRSKSPLCIFPGILKRYQFELFACVLLSASQSAAGYSDAAEIMVNEVTKINHSPENSSTATLCKPGCVTLIDYQSKSSNLEFSRTYNASKAAQDELPARWRHRYEIRLTRQDDDRVVFDHHGIRHVFTSNHDGTYSPVDSTSGKLLLQGERHTWIDSHAIQHGFHGSFLTTLQFPDNQTLTLHYQSGQLDSVTDEHSRKISFVHENGYLSKVQLPDGRALSDASDPCNTDSTPAGAEVDGPATEETPERCDTENNPVPGFSGIDARPGVSTLDARPASCQSYFVDFYGTVRGEEIEAGLEDHPPYSSMVPTNRSFPIVDFINGNELVVVRSRDLASPSFNNPEKPDALFDRLMRDGQQIQTRGLDRLESEGVLSGTENGRTTLITYSELQSVTLHVLIRQDMASTAHWQQIENARTALAARYGIRLQVVIIP